MKYLNKRFVIGISLSIVVGASALLVCIRAKDTDFDIAIASLTAHNTSAYPLYNQFNFPANFGTTSFVSQTETVNIDPCKMDRSMMPVTPGHVSSTDVHSLIPSRPDLRWFAHFMCWWGAPDQPYDIGLDVNTETYIESLIQDLMRRGFDGIVVGWGGENDRRNEIVQKIQSYIGTLPPDRFSFIIWMDEGMTNPLPEEQRGARLAENVAYCRETYFSDPNYEHEDGKPLLLFYGVRGSVGSEEAMAKAKADAGGDMIWVESSTKWINEDWLDQCFDWAHVYWNGVDQSDPYYLSAVKQFLSTVAGVPEKQAIGAMCAGFNGTLTGSLSWSLGKYLPFDHGACMIQRAEAINQCIPDNVTRMQWITWNDWPEGSAVEPGIDNDITVDARVDGTLLKWNISGGTGDECTIDHYEIYATEDGVNAAYLGSVPVGVGQMNLAIFEELKEGRSYQLIVDAVGKPCVRNQLSNYVDYRVVQ